MAKMSIKKKRLVKGVKCCREDKEGKMSTRDLEIKPSLVILLRFSTKKLKKKKHIAVGYQNCWGSQNGS